MNTNKTKVMVFCKRKSRQQYNFTFCGKVLEVVDTYSYLGVIFKYNGTFLETKKKLVEQAQKSLYCIYKLVSNNSIPVNYSIENG